MEGKGIWCQSGPVETKREPQAACDCEQCEVADQQLLVNVEPWLLAGPQQTRAAGDIEERMGRKEPGA